MGYPPPNQNWMGYLPNWDWMGYPPPQSELDGVSPQLGLDGVSPPPRRTGWGTFPPPETEQQSKYLLRSGWYASCVHAGRLSCFYFSLPSFSTCSAAVRFSGLSPSFLGRTLASAIWLRHRIGSVVSRPRFSPSRLRATSCCSIEVKSNNY